MSNIGKIIRVNALPPVGARETNVIYQVAALGAATYTDYAIDENGDLKTHIAAEQILPKNTATIDKPDLGLIGNTDTKQQVDEKISKAKLTSIKGEAIPSGSPTSYNASDYPHGLYEKWDVKTTGTYSNFKDSSNNPITVSLMDLKDNFVQIWIHNGVSQKFLSEKPKSGMIEIPFSSSIKFENEKSISKVTLSAALNYTYTEANAVINSIQVHEIIANGYAITFDNKFTIQVQADIDYTKPISVLFHKPLTANLKPLAIVVNISEIDNSTPITSPRYKVNPAGGTAINTWFDWFEFPDHTVVSTDSIYNVGFFNFGGNNYVGANFTPIGQTSNGRWANFAILEIDWQPNTIYEINTPIINGVRFKTGFVKPTSLLQANTNNYSLVEII